MTQNKKLRKSIESLEEQIALHEQKKTNAAEAKNQGLVDLGGLHKYSLVLKDL